MGRRIALVVSADSGTELTGGRRDAMRVFSLLTDEDLGCCDPSSPPPIVDCGTRAQFHVPWYALMEKWNHQDQLLFYFSGHGVMKNGKYTLAFGPPATKQHLPFDHIAADLQAHAVRRAVIILDACHSGAAARSGAKDGVPDVPKLEQPLPDGVVVLASCRESEQSFEFEEGGGSVFTHLLTQGIRSGLGGKPTADNLIGADDLMGYINSRLCEESYAHYPQKPTYQISSADRTVWIARNKALAAPSSPPASRTRAYSRDELQILYERTERSRHPCPGSTLECLDWELVHQYAEASKTPLDPGEPHEAAARRLGLYSNISEHVLHNAAVLCFARAPHALLQQARSLFIRGDRSKLQVGRVDVLGPLSRQVYELTQLVMSDVFRRLGWRPTDYAATLLAETVREAISNAVTHRDYGVTELVRIAMNDDAIEITNPGAFPNGATFDSLLSAGNYSAPNDAAIAWYLTTLLAYEGVGRGFSVYKAFRDAAGNDAIQCESQSSLRSLKLTIRIPIALALAGGPSPPAPPKPATATRLHTMHGVGPEAAPMAETGRAPAPPPAVVLRTGTEELVGERYRLGPQIGSGGSGSVYLAEDIKLSRQVAIKILPKRFVTAEVRARFVREASLAGRIGHQGIVTVYDVGEESDRLFIVMELVTGTTLEAVISGSSRPRERVPEKFFMQAAWLVHDVADALAAAHESLVIHRDIKPGNLIVDETGRPRILDFGISRAADLDLDKSRLTVTGVAIGTPYYMSPEQIYGKSIDARSDLYSLGVVMYELLCGKVPFDGDSLPELAVKVVYGEIVPPRQLVPAIPIELERICLKALQRDLTQRYASAREMALDLHGYLSTNARYDLVGQDRVTMWNEIRSLLVQP